MMNLLVLLLVFTKLKLNKAWRTKMAVARNTNTDKNASRRILPDVGNTIPENATKATPRVAHDRSGFNGDVLAMSIHECAEGYFKALDDKPAILMDSSQSSGFGEGEAGDTGMAPPSMQEKQFKSWLQFNLSYLHRQLNGPIVIQDKDPKTGVVKGTREIPSLKERRDQSEATVFSHIFDLEGEIGTGAYGKGFTGSVASIKALYWMPVNQAAVEMFQALYDSCMAVYRECYREDWKPLERSGPSKKDVNNAIKADPKIAALLAKREELRKSA
jgi:hypothetical protein